VLLFCWRLVALPENKPTELPKINSVVDVADNVAEFTKNLFSDFKTFSKDKKSSEEERKRLISKMLA
jgi:hypothetical protein